MHLGVALVAGAQPPELVQPAEAALDYPAVDAQPGAVLGLAAGDHGLDSALAERAAVLVAVVAAVGDHLAGSLAWPSAAAAHRLDPVKECQQLRDVVAVGGGQRERQRETRGVGQEVVL